MKDKAYYLALPYKRDVDLVEEEGKAYFLASIKELPGVKADGGDRVEALYHLSQAFNDYLDAMLSWGSPIPEPELWPGEIDLPEMVSPSRVEIEGVSEESVSASSSAPPADSPWRDNVPRWRVQGSGVTTA